MLVGALMILFSAYAYAKNKLADVRNREHADKITAQIRDDIKKVSDDDKNVTDDKKADDLSADSAYEKPQEEASAIEIDGAYYSGIIEIPKISVTLPVANFFSYPQMDYSLCLYMGSFEDCDAVVCGHNTDRFLWDLKSVYDGDEIIFTDVSGQMQKYTVVSAEYIGGTEVDKLTQFPEQWDLTLFTCDYSGYQRYVVRCRKE